MTEKINVRVLTVRDIKYVRLEDIPKYLLEVSDGETHEIREWAKSVAKCFEELK